MSDRLAQIRARLREARLPGHISSKQILVHPASMNFYRHAPTDIAWLVAQLDSTTECGCPIAHVRMHTDECKATRR
jgi:hypothetical protein